MKKIEIDLKALFDELPLGPKYGAYWKERNERLQRRAEAHRQLSEKQRHIQEPPDFIKAIVLRRAQLGMSQAVLANKLHTYQAVIAP